MVAKKDLSVSKRDKLSKVVIIIPTYNEKDNIPRLISYLFDKVFPNLKAYQMHMLIVDDSSPDGTGQLVKKLIKKYPNLHLKVNKKKMGLGGAYLSGMREAADNLQADIIFQMDADFSHDPGVIPDFLTEISQGNDLVLGSRYIPGGSIPSNWGLHRKLMSYVGNLVIRIVMGYFKIHDWTTGYRAIKASLFKALEKEMQKAEFSGYTWQVGFLHKTIRKGYKISEVPIHFVDREYGKSKLGVEYIKNTLFYILTIRFKELERIFRFTVVGSIGALVQLLSLQILRSFFAYQLAFFLAIEIAVLANFILSNLWTFSDRKLNPNQYLPKFIQFNLASAGSILIQQSIALIGEQFIGLHSLFILPILQFNIDTGLVYAVFGILVGMFWNFFAYTKFIWKEK